MIDGLGSEFLNTCVLRMLSIIRENGYKNTDITVVPDLLERGKNYIMELLSNKAFREQFKDDAQMYYYNIACTVFGGGVCYADAWDKDITQIKLGTADALILSQPDINALATDILGLQQTALTDYRRMLDSLFAEFVQIMEPYWSAEDPRPFLFQGLLSFFQSGINLRLSK